MKRNRPTAFFSQDRPKAFGATLLWGWDHTYRPEDPCVLLEFSDKGSDVEIELTHAQALSLADRIDYLLDQKTRRAE